MYWVPRHIFHGTPKQTANLCLRLEWHYTRWDLTATEKNYVSLSKVQDQIWVVIIAVYLCEGPGVNDLILSFVDSGTPLPLVMGAIIYDTWSFLTLIENTFTIQWYILCIFELHVLPLMAKLPTVIFEKDNVWYTQQWYHKKSLPHSTTLPWPARYSPIEHIWDDFWWQMGNLPILLKLFCKYNDCEMRWFKTPYRICMHQIHLCICFPSICDPTV